MVVNPLIGILTRSERVHLGLTKYDGAEPKQSLDESGSLFLWGIQGRIGFVHHRGLDASEMDVVLQSDALA
jgi:hypothetical protein